LSTSTQNLSVGSILLATFVVSFCYIGYRGLSARVEESQGPGRAAPIFVAAGNLIDDYGENEVRADERYKGHWLEVSGEIESINRDVLGLPYFILQSDERNKKCCVHAQLRGSEKNSAATFFKRADVNLVCKGRGKMLGSPMVSDCTIRPRTTQQN
jgi:putative nucleic acid binding protein